MYLGFSYLKLGNESAAIDASESLKKLRPELPVAQPKPYDTPVKLTRKVPAGYTKEARRAKVVEFVELWVELKGDGAVGLVSPKKTLPYGLTENAIEAARKLRFDPAIRNGKPVSYILAIDYYFKLE